VVRVERSGRELRFETGFLSLEETSGEGAGFVWDSSGQVLTAAHVVSGATRVWLRYFDGRRVPGRVLYSNPAAEVAVLVPAGAWPPGVSPMEAGRPGDLEIGDRVLVIGNPLGVDHSLSVGVVSGKHPGRHLPDTDIEADLIQTDASITSGNSGGPVLDGSGRLVAVASFVLSNGIGSGLGFGVSIHSVRAVLASVRCSDLGYDAIELSPPQRNALGIPTAWRRARLVQNVYPGTPASRARLRAGDRPALLAGRPALAGGDVILDFGHARGAELLLWREGAEARVRFHCGEKDKIGGTAS
jgi:S1-C subfamily serine protease